MLLYFVIQLNLFCAFIFELVSNFKRSFLKQFSQLCWRAASECSPRWGLVCCSISDEAPEAAVRGDPGSADCRWRCAPLPSGCCRCGSGAPDTGWEVMQECESGLALGYTCPRVSSQDLHLLKSPKGCSTWASARRVLVSHRGTHVPRKKTTTSIAILLRGKSHLRPRPRFDEHFLTLALRKVPFCPALL